MWEEKEERVRRELYLEIDGGMGRGDITTICSSSWNNFMCLEFDILSFGMKKSIQNHNI